MVPACRDCVAGSQPLGSQAVLWIVCWRLPSASGLCFMPFISVHGGSHDIMQRPGAGRRAVIQPVGEHSAGEASVRLIANHIRHLCFGRDSCCYLLPSWKGLLLLWDDSEDKIPDPPRFQRL